jgi:hypothetical protein
MTHRCKLGTPVAVVNTKMAGQRWAAVGDGLERAGCCAEGSRHEGSDLRVNQHEYRDTIKFGRWQKVTFSLFRYMRPLFIGYC